jgi:hypothetical protein
MVNPELIRLLADERWQDLRRSAVASQVATHTRCAQPSSSRVLRTKLLLIAAPRVQVVASDAVWRDAGEGDSASGLIPMECGIR